MKLNELKNFVCHTCKRNPTATEIDEMKMATEWEHIKFDEIIWTCLACLADYDENTKPPPVKHEGSVMSYEEIPSPMRNAIGVFEMLRRFGFPSEDIYFHVREDKMFFVILQTQGKIFRIDTGIIKEGTRDEAEDKWRQVTGSMRRINKDDLDRILAESPAYQRSMDFARVLEMKGIRIPDSRIRLLLDVTGSGLVEDTDPVTGKVRRVYDKRN